MNYVVIIPARGGSKGVPRKNVRLLGDKPLIVHSIEQALAAENVSAVYVSTDDGEIRRTSEAAGAEVITRPDELASDVASSESALIDAIRQIEHRSGVMPDAVVFLQCTSPIRQHDDIDNAIKLFEQENADSLLSVVESHRFLWRETEDGILPLNYDHTQRPRRQDLKPDMMENGSIYMFKVPEFLAHENRLFGKIVGYPMAPETLYEIDEEQDFVVIEALLSHWQEKGHES